MSQAEGNQAEWQRELTAPRLFNVETSCEQEWQGMPEYVQEKLVEYQKIVVRFRRKEDVAAFAELLAQKHINVKTTSIWFPKLTFQDHMGKRYVEE